MAPEVFSLPVSTSLLAEVNAVGSPKRNKAQDGTIGDRAHMDRVSDHNLDEIGNTGSSSDADKIPEVHARDIDARGPWLIKGGAERIVQLIVANVRSRGHARRRVKYVIYRGRIWVWRKINGAWQFVQQTYTGADQHTEHFHVSFEYGSGSGAGNPENDTSPWGILAAYQEEDMPTADEIAAAVEKRIFAHEITDYASTAKPQRKLTFETWVGYSDSRRNDAIAAADRVTKTLAPLIAAGKVDVKELAGELVAPLTASVLAALPQDTDGVITPEELKTAILGVLTDLAGGKD